MDGVFVHTLLSSLCHIVRRSIATELARVSSDERHQSSKRPYVYIYVYVCTYVAGGSFVSLTNNECVVRATRVQVRARVRCGQSYIL